LDREKLKKDLEIIRGNVGAALKALEEGNPNEEPDSEILKDHVAQTKIKTFQIGGILDRARRCTAPTVDYDTKKWKTRTPVQVQCVGLGKYRPDLKAVLCDKHYSRAKQDGNTGDTKETR